MACAPRVASGRNRRTPMLGRLLLKEATNVSSAKWASSNCRYAPKLPSDKFRLAPVSDMRASPQKPRVAPQEGLA